MAWRSLKEDATPSVLPTLSFPHGRTRRNPSLDRPLGALPATIGEAAIFAVIPNPAASVTMMAFAKIAAKNENVDR